MIEEKSPTMGATTLNNSGKGSDFQRDAQGKSDVFAPNPDTSFVTDAPDEPTHVLPIDGLPDKVQEYISQLSAAGQCPREHVTLACMAAASLAIGSRVQVQGFKRHKNYLSIWGVMISESGTGKSPAMEPPFEWLENENSRLAQHYQDELSQFNALSKKDRECQDKPRVKRLILKDPSAQAIAKRLKYTQHGAGVVLDEVAKFFQNIDQFSSGDSSGAILSLYNGKSLVIDRVDDEVSFGVDTPFFMIFGGLQPARVFDTLASAGKADGGLPQRFLYTYPEEQKWDDYSEEEISDELCQWWDSVIQKLYQPDADKASLIMRPSAEAKRAYIKFFNEMQRVSREANGGVVAQIAAKLQVNVIRWAGVVQMLRHVCNGESCFTISVESMEYAARCMKDYFFWTARRIFDTITMPTTQPKPIGNEELIAEVCKRFNVPSTDALGAALGISGQAVRKARAKVAKK